MSSHWRINHTRSDTEGEGDQKGSGNYCEQ